MESKSLVLNNESTNLIKLVTDCIEPLSFKAAEKCLELFAKAVPFPIWLMTDPNRVMQILINLLSNAVKYTQCGQVTVEVVTEE